MDDCLTYYLYKANLLHVRTLESWGNNKNEALQSTQDWDTVYLYRHTRTYQ